MKSAFDVIKAPLITEKGTLAAEHGQAIFKVDPRATKREIGIAVKALFDVEVKAVRTANYLGKSKRVGRVIGTRAKWKKAYVTLADPQATIDLLEKV